MSDEFDKNSYETPPWLFAWLDAYYGFTLDAFAGQGNALCDQFFSAERSALDNEWKTGGAVFANPPYSSDMLGKCVRRMAIQAYIRNVVVVGLIPPNTDTKWWARYVDGSASSVILCTGRISFYKDGKETKGNRGLSAIVVWNPRGVAPTATSCCLNTHYRCEDMGTIKKNWEKLA